MDKIQLQESTGDETVDEAIRNLIERLESMLASLTRLN